MPAPSAAREVLLFWLRLIALALVPVAVARFSPALGAGLGLLTPIPLAYGMARRGVLEGLLAVALVSLGAMAALGPQEGWFFLLQHAPLVLGITWALRSRLPVYLPVMGAAALVAFAALVGLALASAVTGIGMGALWWESADPFGFLSQPQPPVPAGSPGAEQAAEQFKWMMELWKRLFAGIWVASLLLLVLFYAVVTRGLLLQRGEIPSAPAPFLAGWALPWPFVAVFIALGFGILLAQGPVQTAAANAMVPLGTLYGIQGMVVSGHLFAYWRIPPMVRFLGFFLLALWSPVVLIAGVGLTGLLDTWFDFRRRFRPTEPPSAE